MAWYREGKIGLTTGSKNVVGIGTAFVRSVSSGFALYAPDNRFYEVEAVTSDTALVLRDAYTGATVAESDYAIIQTQGTIAELASQVAELLSTFGPLREAVPEIMAGIETVGDGVAAAQAAKGQAEAARDQAAARAAEAAASVVAAAAARDQSVAAKDASESARNQAETKASEAAGSASAAEASAQQAALIVSTVGGDNLLINGGMMIDQRNNGAAQTFTAGAALAYCVDRWYGYCTGANVTGQRVAGTAPNKYNYRFTGAAGVSKIGFGHRIESANSQHLAGRTATLSADLANSLLTQVTWTAWYANTENTFGTLASPTRTQIATGTFTVNGTLSRYSAQIPIPAAATTGIEIELSVGAQTSGTWTVGRVKLEDGAVSTPYAQTDYVIERLRCARYCRSMPTYVVQQAYAASAAVGYFLPVPTMRATPVLSTTSGFVNFTSGGGTTPVTPVVSSLGDGLRVDSSGASGLTAGNATILIATNPALLLAEL